MIYDILPSKIMAGSHEGPLGGKPDRERRVGRNPQAFLYLDILYPPPPTRENGVIPSGPTVYYDRPPFFTVSHPYLRDLHSKRRANNREVVEQLIAPQARLTNGNVLELVAAYYLGNFHSFDLYKDGQPYPPLPEGHWFAPIRTTYESLGDEKRIWSTLLSVPTAPTIEDAFAIARREGREESSHAASRQVNLVGVEVLLSGHLLPPDEDPQWFDVWLVPPEELIGRAREIEQLKKHLGEKGYKFPDE